MEASSHQAATMRKEIPHGRLHGEPQAPGSQHDPQAYDEGDTAPDIAPGIALGGDLVQPVRLCHVVEHGVIEHKTGGIADPGDHEDDQEAQPGGGDAHGHASDRPPTRRVARKTGFL